MTKYKVLIRKRTVIQLDGYIEIEADDYDIAQHDAEGIILRLEKDAMSEDKFEWDEEAFRSDTDYTLVSVIVPGRTRRTRDEDEDDDEEPSSRVRARLRRVK